jgi:hypothetical protein
MMHAVSLLFCLMQMPGAPARTSHDNPAELPQQRSAQLSDQIIQAVEPNPVGPTAAQRQLQLRRFEQSFNKLVVAVEEFSQAYNASRGLVWPADKAAALRKAMQEMQKIDPNFRPPKELVGR